MPTADAADGSLHMNHSIYSADRTTHLKIVIIALVIGIAGIGFGLSTRADMGSTQSAGVIKAGKPILTTSSGLAVMR
jgi:hypothetical protein